ncbi:MAG: hypothetical protein HY689_11770 [Chloroflexi bacterium]|nr:hypothetical protein [Chloroflexota bacterium]
MDHSAAPPRTRTLMVVSHTHWDREWYLPFQAYRLKLAQMMDSLLHLLESDPDYRFFILDGHTALVEDYLELHPEQEPRLRALVQAGRLFMGPWYILPDEFLVGGEALVRNLLEGHRIARRFGEPMKVGHLPDQFGHIGQMPQILRGFGIDTAVIWRGVGDPVHTSEFWWEAPDGSRVLAAYLRHGYDQAHNLPADPDALLLRLARIRAQLEPLATTDVVLLMNGTDHASPQANLSALLAAANAALPDARMVHGNLPLLMETLRRSAAARGVAWPAFTGEFRSGQRTPLLPGVLSARMWIKQRNHAGEQLLSRWAEPFSAWALSLDTPDGSEADLAHERWVRGALRQAWKYLLQNQPHDSICGCSIDQVHEEMRPRFDWVEQIGEEVTARALETIAGQVDTRRLGWPEGATPILVFNPVGGPRTDTVTVRTAIPRGGAFCLLDDQGQPVPFQVEARHARETFSTEVRRAELAHELERCGEGEGCAVLDAFARWLLVRAREDDPAAMITEVRVAAGPRPESLRVDLEVAERGAHCYLPLKSALAQLRQSAQAGATELYHLRVFRTDREEADLRFLAPAVPGYGYRCFALAPAGQHRPPSSSPARGGEPADPLSLAEPALSVSQETGEGGPSIENEFFTVAVDPADGTLTITDKERGVTLRGLHRFVDGGDAGDEYNYAPPAAETLIVGPDAPPTVTLVEDGPARWTLKIAMTLNVPRGLTPDRRERSAARVPCPVTSYVSLAPGVRRVDLRTEVDNRAQDHRLRVLFPAPVRTDTSWAEGHFGVVARPITAPEAGPDWLEDPVATYPQKTFVDVHDAAGGLLVANRGLPEFEVLPTEDGVAVALTLLRCVGWLSRDDLSTRRGYAGPALETPGAQCLGPATFAYALVPHGGTWEAALAEAHRFNAPMRAMTTDVHPGRLPERMSFLAVQPEQAVVSTVKLPEEGEGVIVRLYNPCDREMPARVRAHRAVRLAERVRLDERSLTPLASNAAGLNLALGPAEIITLRLLFTALEPE